MGAEFTQVYARHRGAGIVPSENAVPVTEEARAQQGLVDPKAAAATSTRGGPPSGRLSTV